jgi:hypothetical protein
LSRRGLAIREKAEGREHTSVGISLNDLAELHRTQGTSLGPQALVLFLDTPEWKPLPEETFVWVVTKTSFRWARLGLGTPSLIREVAALCCGLDRTAWDQDAAACARALGMPLDRAPRPRPTVALRSCPRLRAL